jgi:DNA-binding MarR family transcriptional regulator
MPTGESPPPTGEHTSRDAQIEALQTLSTAHLIKLAEMAARNRLEAAIRVHRLSSGQLLLLTTLDRNGRMTPASLARHLHITPQAMTTLLRPLDARGLLHRVEDETNRRRILISLTADARDLLAQIQQITPEVDAGITAGLDPAQLASLRALLAHVAIRSD